MIKVLNLDNIPDSQGEIFDSNGLEVPKEVPLYLNFNYDKPIGHAILEKREDGVYAQINTSTFIKGLYPAIGGKLSERDGNTLLKVKITMLGVCNSPNSDKRILPLETEEGWIDVSE